MKRSIATLVALAAFVGLVAWGSTAKKNITSLAVVHAASPTVAPLKPWLATGVSPSVEH